MLSLVKEGLTGGNEYLEHGSSKRQPVVSQTVPLKTVKAALLIPEPRKLS